jgi:hypothetical protein
MISSNDFKAISVLDLEPIKTKLMHKPSGEGWSAEKANAVEIEYRRFLFLAKTFPAEQIAPLIDVDTFWHYHILDTMKYALDCEEAFGYFLHHYPYVGMHGEDSEQEREEGGDRMQELYEQTFGDSYDLAARAIAQAGSNSPMNSKQAAYCVLDSKHVLNSKQAAYCVLGSKQAAYCVLDSKHVLDSKQAAYCVLDSKQAAYCVLDSKHVLKSKQAAYCVLDSKHVIDSKQAAYCVLVSKKVAGRAASNDAAYRTAVSVDRSGHLLHQAA